jgi:hypothetical protein
MIVALALLICFYIVSLMIVTVILRKEFHGELYIAVVVAFTQAYHGFIKGQWGF